jgi:hypothetical protein
MMQPARRNIPQPLFPICPQVTDLIGTDAPARTGDPQIHNLKQPAQNQRALEDDMTKTDDAMMQERE